eukprot:2613754-Pleurochrysis_carterae.AAC.2
MTGAASPLFNGRAWVAVALRGDACAAGEGKGAASSAPLRTRSRSSCADAGADTTGADVRDVGACCGSAKKRTTHGRAKSAGRPSTASQKSWSATRRCRTTDSRRLLNQTGGGKGGRSDKSTSREGTGRGAGCGSCGVCVRVCGGGIIWCGGSDGAGRD